VGKPRNLETIAVPPAMVDLAKRRTRDIVVTSIHYPNALETMVLSAYLQGLEERRLRHRSAQGRCPMTPRVSQPEDEAVYVVVCETGMWDDYRTRNVRAFGTQEAAYAFAVACLAYANAAPPSPDSDNDRAWTRQDNRVRRYFKNNPHDPEAEPYESYRNYKTERVAFQAAYTPSPDAPGGTDA
jgi:hypothetical protein